MTVHGALGRLRVPALAVVFGFALAAVSLVLLAALAKRPVFAGDLPAPAPLVLASNDVFAPFPGTPVAAPSVGERMGVSSAYARLPLAFEPNRGQFDRRVSFAARGSGYALFLARRSVLLSLARARDGARSGLSIGFLGASSRAHLAAGSQLAGRVNYLLGRDRSRRRTDIPTYGRVRYSQLWPGIDAAFYGDQGRVEYDFYLSPGADSARIGLSFAGAKSVRADRGGALLLGLGAGSVRQLRPRAYQLVGGRRRAVPSRYVVRGDRVGVRLGRYDRRLPLVIDPALVYSTYLGGSNGDSGYAIAVDSTGAAYVTGETASANFPTTTGVYRTMPLGGIDVFVTKLNPAGSAPVYSTYLGGSLNDYGLGIAVDASGAAYVTGYTNSTDLPTTAGAYQTSYGGGSFDGFVSKLNPAGSALAYSTFLGGSSYESGNAIAVDASGAVYVAGNTGSANFPTTAGAHQTAFGGGSNDAFVTKLNPAGSALLYSTFLGGSGDDEAYGIAIDSTGAAYVAGFTNSTNFPTASALQGMIGGVGHSNAFVTKLNPAGSALVYSTYLGGALDDHAYGVAIDSTGEAYVTGYTNSTNFPTKSPIQASSAGGSDAFVSKLNAAGSALVYSTYLGGSGNDGGNGIAVDTTGAAYVTGATSSTNFPTMNAFQGAYGASGGNNAFVTKLNPAGSALAYSTYLGGSGSDGGNGIAVESTGAADVTGYANSINFPTTAGAYQTIYGGNTDAFVAKLSGAPTGTTQPATNVTQTSATLNGTVNPNGDATAYSFQYGTSTAYGSQTLAQSAGSDSSNHAESTSVTSLSARTTYHFRAVATNSGGTSYGADQTLTTAAPPTPPVVTKFVLLGALTTTPTRVSFSLLCQAAAGAICNGLAKLTTLERLRGPQILALSARKKRHNQRVLVGSKSFSLATGTQQKIVVPLNPVGRKLLRRFGHIPATLTISLLNTKPPTVITTKTTIKSKKRKKRRHHR